MSTRVVVRSIDAGNEAQCRHCDSRVKFISKQPSAERRQVIVNVYVDGKWNRVEHFHAPCYDEAGQPYGEPKD